jgi:hypothetical protein
MPLSEGYGILKGKVIERQTERNDKDSPQYTIKYWSKGMGTNIEFRSMLNQSNSPLIPDPLCIPPQIPGFRGG